MTEAEILALERRGVEQEMLYTLLPHASLTYISKDAEAVITFSTEIRFPKEMLLSPKRDMPKTEASDIPTDEKRELET